MQHVDKTAYEFGFALLGSALRGKVKENLKIPPFPFKSPTYY